ncbi:myxococcus cysteine-rich repeat containing protein [Nanoarchaeota archaeon]
MLRRLLLVFIVLIIFLAPSLSSDVFSINSGGGTNIVLLPEEKIEGFFFSISATSVCGDGIVELTEQCDDGNFVAEDGCSATCGLECGNAVCDTWESCSSCSTDCGSCVVPPPSDGPGGPSSSLGLVVSPREINLNLVANSDPEDLSAGVTKIIRVTNFRTNTTTVAVSQVGLEGMVYINDTRFNLSSGATKDLEVVFVAPINTGIFTGKIVVGSEAVLVSLNVKPRLLLFDSNIVVLNKDYQVRQNEELKTQITLTPMGDQERLDVTLEYEVKDYDGKVWFEKSETLLLEEKMVLDREFDIGEIPMGDYIIGLILIYPEGEAPSSAHFEVIPARGGLFGTLIIILISAIIIILIILIIVVIRRRRKEQRQPALGPQPIFPIRT